MTRLLIATALALGALLSTAVTAAASSSQESIFQDDGALVWSGAATRAQTLDQLRSLGVDTIRVNLIWNRVERSRGTYDFQSYDGLVADAQARGFNVLFTVTGPGPRWASHCGGTCKPSGSYFGRFVKAAGLHFRTVHRWSIWNEPNQAGWLYPQWRRYHGRYQPYAPLLYRDLAYGAIGGLQHSGHAHDQILLGETAPIGRHTGGWAKRSMSPADFLDGVFCIDSRGHRLHGTNARALGCHSHFRKLAVNGYAHHPYTRAAAADPRGRVNAGDITMSTLGRLTTVLHRGAHARAVRGGLGIYLTEYGVQTNPPDRNVGVSLSRQAEWLNETDYMAYRNRAVRSVSQYELFDDAAIQSFQTGLRFRSGKAKPSLAAYKLPIWVVYSHGRTTVWGQVRPGGRGARVDVIYRPSRHRPFRRLTTLTTRNAKGFLTYRTRRRGTQWRLVWVDSSGRHVAQSRVAVPRSR